MHLCTGSLNMRLQRVPDFNREGFCRGPLALHEWHIHVEVPVVSLLYDMFLHQVAEGFGVEDEASITLELTLHCDMQLIVVAMPVGVGALAEDFGVVRIIPGGIEKAVRGIEVLHAGDVHHSTAKVPKACGPRFSNISIPK